MRKLLMLWKRYKSIFQPKLATLYMWLSENKFTILTDFQNAYYLQIVRLAKRCIEQRWI